MSVVGYKILQKLFLYLLDLHVANSLSYFYISLVISDEIFKIYIYTLNIIAIVCQRLTIRVTWRKFILSSDNGDSGSKKCELGYDSTYLGIRQILLLGGSL